MSGISILFQKHTKFVKLLSFFKISEEKFTNVKKIGKYHKNSEKSMNSFETKIKKVIYWKDYSLELLIFFANLLIAPRNYYYTK